MPRRPGRDDRRRHLQKVQVDQPQVQEPDPEPSLQPQGQEKPGTPGERVVRDHLRRKVSSLRLFCLMSLSSFRKLEFFNPSGILSNL